ncbi:MAG: adenylosuccinate lyase [Nitrospirota bacterium]|nr:adenylosuccinate lyase [Nitrospirota bacterium]
MIERYTRPRMGRLWSEEARFRYMLKVELYALKALNQRGIVPDGIVEEVEQKATINVARVAEIEATTRHDVIAFVTSVTENLSEGVRQWMHWGLTSSDVLDTALGMQMRDAADLLLADLDGLLDVIRHRARETRDMPCVGRSHGIHGEPISFGLKFASWYAELDRGRRRLAAVRDRVAVGAVSGAMGNFAHLGPDVEADICKMAGLQAEPVSTQVVPRDRHAEFVQTIALIGAALERISVEIRHLQRTEVLEAEEGFVAGQKGSSAMPHKRNPVGSENISGLARLLRGHAVAALENVALWHERDISHSSVERVILPDSCILLDYMLARMAHILGNLGLFPEQMQRNLNLTGGLVYSQRVLLALAEAGAPRDEAYRWVQRNAMEAWQERGSFQQRLKRDPDVCRWLPEAAVDKCFEAAYYLRHVDEIYRRVFGRL